MKNVKDIIDLIDAEIAYLGDGAKPLYKLGHKTGLENLKRRINQKVCKMYGTNMATLGAVNYAILEDGIKTCGSYDPQELLPYIQDKLYAHESDDIIGFLTWVHEGGLEKAKFGLEVTKRGFGHENYEERFQEYLEQL